MLRFSDGLIAEMGAAGIPDTHAATLHYVRRFSPTLDRIRGGSVVGYRSGYYPYCTLLGASSVSVSAKSIEKYS